MKKKIKLIFFHPYSFIGGADNSLGRLIKNLDKKKYSITFISLNKSYLKRKINKVNFISLNNTKTIFSLFKLRNILKQKILKEKFSKIILISNQNFANIVSYFSALKLKNLKLIFIERNHLDELFYFKNLSQFLKNIIIYGFIKIIYPRVDKIIGISNVLRKDLQKKTGAKVNLIYNPANDPEIYKLSKKKINFKFDTKKKYVISIARFTKRKGIEDIIEAFYNVQKILENINLILIGYGDRENKINQLIKKKKLSNKIFIFKKCSNPYPYLKKSHLFILNSKYEGFGNVLVESVMLNTPVISTNCNSGPSEILLNGKGGCLIPVKENIQILTSKIIEHFKNEKKLKKKNRYALSHIKRFKLNTNIKNFDKLFTNI